MAIGVSKRDFYRSTLSGLADFDEAYQLKRKLDDDQAYLQGIYTYEAVAIAIGNAFRQKGSKPAEYRDKPILQQMEDKKRLLNPTEEEKKLYTDNLFAMLGHMQTNFEKHHGGE